ncbi:MAG: hypothetical protein F4090_02195 [Nitrospira sp. SB0672_bin_25]|nr:hypothetical protein [Nitrospira sp. SB0666_bin_27]MYF23987.1 hypothetical protein [Nitrospira sp. SB0678_bin_10]MYJ53716.1 hypothetical protein [Nitrospira sp. SB0672_bin_25]
MRSRKGTVMQYAGWLVMVLGILFQVLVPLGVLGRPTGRWLGMPAEIAALFMATGTVVIGMVIVYLTWLKPYAARLDRSMKS